MQKIRNLPISERPYEKYLKYGESGLSDADLLAIILKNGTSEYSALDISKTILSGRQNNLLNLFEMSYEDLIKVPGIGKVKAIQLKAVCELSKRISITKRGYSLKLNNPKSIADYYMEQMRHLSVEVVIGAYFDSKNNFLGDKLISKGAIDSSMVVAGSIFKGAIERDATKIVLLHNHPSGDSNPSNDDILVTDNLAEGSCILGLRLNDHIIIGDNEYFSFFENNLI